MSVVDVGQVVTGGAAALVALVFGYPAWVMARHRLRNQKQTQEEALERQQLHDLAGAVARVLTGTDDPAQIAEPSDLNPSIRDLLHDALEETAALSSAVALLHEIMRIHLAEEHGGVPPGWMLHAAATNPGRWLADPPRKRRR